MKSWQTAALATILAIGSGGAHAVEVVTSVRPIHSLVASVMEGSGTPLLLLENDSSPHTASLKPSQARALADADVVFWVGPDMETFLAGALENTAEKAAVVALAEADGVERLRVRDAEHFDAHDHGDDDHDAHDDDDEHDHEGHDDHDGHGDDHDADHEAHDDHDDDHGAYDAHIWLDPLNARAMVETIAVALVEADPANADLYVANARATRARLAGLVDELQATLEPVAGRPFIVFHDAYQYLEVRTGLTAVGALSVNPEVTPGARHLRELRETIVDLDAVCVFAEPQFPSGTVRVVTEGTPARTAVLDPLGSHIDAGPDQYPAMMREMAAAIRACLED